MKGKGGIIAVIIGLIVIAAIAIWYFTRKAAGASVGDTRKAPGDKGTEGEQPGNTSDYTGDMPEDEYASTDDYEYPVDSDPNNPVIPGEAPLDPGDNVDTYDPSGAGGAAGGGRAATGGTKSTAKAGAAGGASGGTAPDGTKYIYSASFGAPPSVAGAAKGGHNMIYISESGRYKKTVYYDKGSHVINTVVVDAEKKPKFGAAKKAK
jgi:hypothetical protein